jgi:hypothetical protein
MRKRIIPAAALVILSAGCAGCAGFDAGDYGDLLDRPLDSETVAAGLREALAVGTRRATDTTSATDGFFGNALIRIALPEQYDGVAGAVRGVGLGSEVDAFELGMNRAAEKASGEAVAVFRAAIAGMTIADAFGILEGGDTAATDYFRDRTGAELAARFRPIVADKMAEVGIYRIYEDLADAYRLLPVSKPAAVDLEEYITDRTTRGIFLMLEQEEARIRRDPAARSTELLRKVFGK